MNFDHVNKIADFFRDQLLPHLTCRMQVGDFGNYLGKIVESPSCKWMKHELKAFPINYFVDPEKFVKRYESRCIAFVGSTSPQEGAMGIVYQISPTLHVFARLFNWIEQEKVRSYLTLTVAFRNEAEYIQFFDDNKNLRMTGDTEQRMAGFAGSKEDSPQIGFGGLMVDSSKVTKGVK